MTVRVTVELLMDNVTEADARQGVSEAVSRMIEENDFIYPNIYFWETSAQAECRECGEAISEKLLSGLGYCEFCEQGLEEYSENLDNEAETC